jgi:hypothetical protein
VLRKKDVGCWLIEGIQDVIFPYISLTPSVAVDLASLFSSEKFSELILHGLIRKIRGKQVNT